MRAAFRLVRLAKGLTVQYLSLIHIYYAGSDRHGMEYRPFFMAKRWVQAGHRVTVAASSFSHLRSKNPDMAGKKVQEEMLDGVRYVWIAGPSYQGNGLGLSLIHISDDQEMYEHLVSLRVHGKGQMKYDNVRVGLNARLDTLQAAILLPKLHAFDRENEARNAAAAHYTSLLKGAFNTCLLYTSPEELQRQSRSCFLPLSVFCSPAREKTLPKQSA